MSNPYDYISGFATAIRDSTAVKNYCTTNFSRGLLVQIDDDGEDPIDSGKCPYCCIFALTDSDDSPVSEKSDIKLKVEVGTAPITEPPYSSVTTARSATANGLTVYGAGEKAADLLDLCLTAMRAVYVGGSTVMESSTVQADGLLLFPLQIASSVVSITTMNDLSSF